MKSEKIKSSYKVYIILVVLAVLFILFNQVDSPPPVNVFSREDQVPAAFDKSNGFYLVLSLIEPREVDVRSAETIGKYREMFDPAFGREGYMKPFEVWDYHKKFDKYKRKLRFLNGYKKDWTAFAGTKKKEIRAVNRELSFLARRYAWLLESKIVGDITAPWFRFHAVPLLSVSRLYTALQILDILESGAGSKGKKGLENILAQVDLSKKLIKSARSSFVSRAGKTMLRDSLMALAGLMNRKECPVEWYALILDRLPPLKYEDFGSRNVFVSYYLFTERWIERTIERRSRQGNPGFRKKLSTVARLLLQKQRTKNYYFQYISACIRFETQPPFSWETDRLQPEDLHNGYFWWLQNLTGKFIFSEDLKPDFEQDVIQSHRTKIIYQLTRTAAELHREYTGETPVKELLRRLESYRRLDPYSGKPYTWNKEKGILYSVGCNRRDDKGAFDSSKHSREAPPDIVVPCRLKY